MKSDKNPNFTADEMLALRDAAEALKVITEKLRVQEMGPADWIKTKHEVKAWLETAGDLKEAEAIVARAGARRELWQTQSITQKMSERQQRGQRIDD